MYVQIPIFFFFYQIMAKKALKNGQFSIDSIAIRQKPLKKKLIILLPLKTCV